MCIRDSSNSGLTRQNDPAGRIQPYLNPTSTAETALAGRASISSAPGRRVLGTAMDSGSQTEIFLDAPLREPQQGRQETINISEPESRASSPSSVTSGEYHSCDEFPDDSDENIPLPLLVVPDAQNLSRHQETPAPVSTEETNASGVQTTVSSGVAGAPEFAHIYHEIYFQIQKRLHEAFRQGIHLSIRKVRVNPEVVATAGVSNESISAGASKDSSSKKVKKGLGDRFVENVLGLKPEVMLKKPGAMEALTGSITEVILAELKEATSRPVSATDRVDKYSVDLEGEDAWANGFTRSISTILVHLTHQAFRDKLTWADTDDGKKKASEVVAGLISDLLDLPPPSAQANAEGDSVDTALTNGIVSALQSGSRFFNKKMKGGVKSESLRKIINNALFSMMAEGIELTENNIDELLSRVRGIIINILMSIRGDIVRIFREKNQNDPAEINLLRDRLVSRVATSLESFVKDHGGWATRTAISLAGFFAPKKTTEFTEGKIKKEINEKLDEYLKIFQNKDLFEKEINEMCIRDSQTTG